MNSHNSVCVENKTSYWIFTYFLLKRSVIQRLWNIQNICIAIDLRSRKYVLICLKLFSLRGSFYFLTYRGNVKYVHQNVLFLYVFWQLHLFARPFCQNTNNMQEKKKMSHVEQTKADLTTANVCRTNSFRWWQIRAGWRRRLSPAAVRHLTVSMGTAAECSAGHLWEGSHIKRPESKYDQSVLWKSNTQGQEVKTGEQDQ